MYVIRDAPCVLHQDDCLTQRRTSICIFFSFTTSLRDTNTHVTSCFSEHFGLIIGRFQTHTPVYGM